jgi:hypothetical protein
MGKSCLVLRVLAVVCFFGASSAVTREYFVAAVNVEWDYAPSGRNLVTDDQRYNRFS